MWLVYELMGRMKMVKLIYGIQKSVKGEPTDWQTITQDFETKSRN